MEASASSSASEAVSQPLAAQEAPAEVSAEAKEPGVAASSSANSTSTPTKEDWELQRDHEKQLGDQAFRMGGFKTAIGHYTQAISLDPEFVIAYSNRSAAYLKNSEKSKALRDAETVTQLDPTYAKGFSRLAAALHSLKRWEQARDAYQKVLDLDKANGAAQKGVTECQAELDKIKNSQQTWQEEETETTKQTEEETKPAAEDAVQQLEEETGKDDDDDDLLNDFFQEVEEVTKKPKEGGEPEPPAPTNNVKNEKVILGTAQEQMDRLLQSNYEWRNLNPYYVMQLPHTATDDDVARRYKALSLMLHPDKNVGDPRAQQAFDQVKKAKTILLDDPDRARHARQLIEEGLKQANSIFHKQSKTGTGKKTLEELQEKEVMRIFAEVEQKRREVEDRERKFEQRTQQQEDALEAKERKERQFDKSWRKEERVDKRVGNWRDFATGKKKKKKIN